MGITPIGLPSSVLFICTHNAIRSPMAEAMLKHYHRHKIFIDSAGIRTHDLDPFAVSAMDELGIDLSRHRPKRVVDLDDDNFDLVVTLSPEAHHHAIDMTRTVACDVEYWPTADPSHVEGNRSIRLDAYRASRDGILARILDRFPVETAPTV